MSISFEERVKTVNNYGTINELVKSTQYKPFPIPAGGLKTPLT